MVRNFAASSGRRSNRRRWFRQAFLLLSHAAAVHTGGSLRASRSALERLRVGAVGVGNRGNDNLADVPVDETAALCDVDLRYLDQAHGLRRHAKRYRDFREMLDREPLDAVIVSGPDHMHAPAVLWALRRNMHVYCERPLARTIGEIAQIRRYAQLHPCVTQMGNQHHSSYGYRRAAEALRRGLLGRLQAVHAWTVRPLWPQGLQRPAEQPPVPDYLEWELWLGPAPPRPYHPAYHPVRWRAWWDFGTGTLGDMAIHLLDPVLTGLGLPEPRRISAEVPRRLSESFPEWSIVRFKLAHEDGSQWDLFWYDGGKRPPMDVLGSTSPPPNGVLVIGERGRMFIPELGGTPRFVPPSLGKELPEQDQPALSHMQNFLAACRGETQPYCDFHCGGQLSQFCLLGNVALFIDGELLWDPTNQRFVGNDSANARLVEPARAGWRIDDL